MIIRLRYREGWSLLKESVPKKVTGNAFKVSNYIYLGNSNI